MKEKWEEDLECATQCSQCSAKLHTRDQRILSVYTHRPICLECKTLEEQQPDYEDAAKQMMANCAADTGRPYGDPGGYCFHHFCPYKC